MSKTRIFSRAESRRALFSGVISALSVTAGYVPFLFVMQIVSHLTSGEKSYEFVIGRLIIVFICLLLKVILSSLALSLAHKNAFSVLANIRLKLINHMRELTPSFFQKRKVGDLGNIVNHDVEQMESYVGHALPDLIVTSFMPISIFAFITILDWRLGLSIISFVPLIFAFLFIFDKALKPFMNKYSKDTKELNEEIIEYISSITIIKAFNKSEKRTEKVLCKMDSYEEWLRKISISISAYGGTILGLLKDGGLIVTTIIGSGLLVQKQITPDIFILAVIMSIFFNASLTKLMAMHHSLMIFGISKGRVGSILLEKPGLNNDKAQFLKIENGDIIIKNLTFYYDDKEALNNIDLEIKKNSKIALIGTSGSGKTTLAHILMGFLPDYKGSIKIKGNELKLLSDEALTSLVTIVQQDVFLFNISIRDNIALGKENATEQEIDDAIEKAQLSSLIESLPEGKDTIVGEAGAKLSGGEKQRISIARVILKNSPIVILDEATSAIDPNNEYLIQKAIHELQKNKTVITIAHNLYSVMDSDKIVLLENGRINSCGTHQQLMKDSPRYQEMIIAQKDVESWTIKEQSLEDAYIY